MLCDEAFIDIKPDKEAEAFYDAWAETEEKGKVAGGCFNQTLFSLQIVLIVISYLHGDDPGYR